MTLPMQPTPWALAGVCVLLSAVVWRCMGAAAARREEAFAEFVAGIDYKQEACACSTMSDFWP